MLLCVVIVLQVELVMTYDLLAAAAVLCLCRLVRLPMRSGQSRGSAAGGARGTCRCGVSFSSYLSIIFTARCRSLAAAKC
jgi:hypothetical protein